MKNDISSQIYKKRLKRFKQFSKHLAELISAKPAYASDLQKAVFGTLNDLADYRDEESVDHIVRTQKYLQLLIEQMNKDGIYMDETHTWDLDNLLSSVYLHDIGKVAITDAILNKHGPLTPEEFEIMKNHVSVGVKVIRKIRAKIKENEFLRHSYLITGSHHEKWDGSGYPAGLKGLEIPLEGRLMAIADVYDALVSRRSYKEPLSADEARKAIENGRGTHFDPALVDVFAKVADKFAEIARS